MLNNAIPSDSNEQKPSFFSSLYNLAFGQTSTSSLQKSLIADFYPLQMPNFFQQQSSENFFFDAQENLRATDKSTHVEISPKRERPIFDEPSSVEHTSKRRKHSEATDEESILIEEKRPLRRRVKIAQPTQRRDIQLEISKKRELPVFNEPLIAENPSKRRKRLESTDKELIIIQKRKSLPRKVKVTQPTMAVEKRKQIKADDNVNKNKRSKTIRRDAKTKVIHTPQKAKRSMRSIAPDSVLGKFIQRLRNNAQKSTVPPLLDDIFFQSDLKNIFEYVINYITRNANKFATLMNGKSVRLDKTVTNLTRHLQISKSSSGKFRLFVETNRKSKMGEKNLENALLGKGTFKTVLRCYQLDTETPKTWACAKVKNEIRETVDEAKLTNELIHPYIAHFEIGNRYKNGKKITLYSKIAIGTLEDVVNGKIAASATEKETLMMQIMDAVAFAHSKGVIHQDIKPQNILIYRDKNGSLVAKLSDFGLAVKSNPLNRGKINAPLSTIGYESPQILAYYQDKGSEQYDYYFSDTTRTLGKAVFNRFHSEIIKPNRACQSNDCWALGVMYYELMHGKQPNLSVVTYKRKSGNSIIDGLLSVQADQRLDSASALEQIKQRVEEMTARSNHMTLSY